MKRITALFFVLILLASLLCGCQMMTAVEETAPVEDGSIRVYYKDAAGVDSLSAPYALETTGDAAIRELFTVLQNGQFSDGVVAVPQSVSLARSAWQEHSLVLYLEGDYPLVGSTEEILCRYSIVQTMFQLEDVEGVTIHLNNRPLTDDTGMEIGTMNRDSFLEDAKSNATPENPVSVSLYYSNASGTKLHLTTGEVMENGTISVERQIVEKLIEGPSEEGCYPTIPSTTRVLSVNVHNRICYVNLNSSFVDETLASSSFVRVYSLVNSLTALKDVDYVQLMINGAADFAYSSEISFSAPLGPNMDLVES